MFGKAIFALAAIAAVSAAPVELEKRKDHHGQATFFDVGLGACGNWNVESDWIVALNSDQWNQNGLNSDGWTSVNCGQNMVITNNNNGKTAVAKVEDQCPTCDEGSLDMSRSLFSYLNDGDMGAGVFPISWHFKKRN